MDREPTEATKRLNLLNMKVRDETFSKLESLDEIVVDELGMATDRVANRYLEKFPDTTSLDIERMRELMHKSTGIGEDWQKWLYEALKSRREAKLDEIREDWEEKQRATNL